ncbi:hypothetical protein L218DRAFT_989357 [Marasmius fiardii PR-910]|nr:hypothetical protein L218DRAFT_989357 [Marasmius fiardii PR-910]
MGVFDTYCCFCSGPLEDARAGWLNMLTETLEDEDHWPPKDGEWANDPGYPVPTKPIEEIVTISEEDGEAWEDWVVVSPVWPETYVSPPCSVDSYGSVEIEASEEWNTDGQPYLHIHRICLSFLCRRNAITPRELWESICAPDSQYQKYAERIQGLLYSVDYYDMEERNGQSFGFAIERYEPPEDRPDLPKGTWWDPESMEDTKWILARPTVLPAPEPLEPSIVQPSAVTERKVFEVSELFDAILNAIVDLPPEIIESELKANGKGNEKSSKNSEDGQEEEEDEEEDEEPIFESPSAVTAAETLLSLAQVDRWFYHSIIRNRQGIFLQALRNFGWMLPCTPADWAHSKWPEELTTQTPLWKQANRDWRRYMIACFRRDDPHLLNRWRFNMMAVQFARGTDRHKSDENPDWFWNVGKLGVKSSLEKPDAQVWEITPENEDDEGDDDEGGDEGHDGDGDEDEDEE